MKDASENSAYFFIGVIVWFMAAWFTHVIHAFMDESWLLLIAGAIFFPVAIVNGTGIWFGAW